ncbi:uncharacterized protein LOC144128134 isoform X1 [Amblyomma americanum]
MSADRAEVETILGSILASEQNGLSLRRLDQEYCSTVGTSIPFKELGHTSLEAFLGTMPEVVTVERGSGEELIARAAYNAATAHITKLVAEQKPGPIRVRRQQAQRPCHWKVHPYHKSWARGTVPAKKEPRQDPSVPGPSNPYLLPATTSQASSRGSSLQPRRPVAASRPKVPVSSPVPARRPLQDVPANVVKQPGSSWHWNKATTERAPRHWKKYPGAQNYAHDNGFHKPSMNAWMWFLKRAGVVRQKAFMYAKLLMWHGVNPSSMWLFTGQDIFQMGIGDFRDIYLIQEHAHQLHSVHRSTEYNGNVLDGSGYLNPYHEGPQEQDGACNFVHVPLHRNQKWFKNQRMTFKNQHYFGHPARHGHSRFGFSVTPLNLRSVVGGYSIKERLGWRS